MAALEDRTLIDLEPMLGTSLPELQGLQLSRLRATLEHAYRHNPVYRCEFDRAGVQPRDLNSLADLAHFPFTTKTHLRDAKLKDIVGISADIRVVSSGSLKRSAGKAANVIDRR